MNRKERCEHLISLGYKYDQETGIIYGPRGNALKSTLPIGYMIITIKSNNKTYNLYQHHFAYYVVYGEVVKMIDHINGVKTDNRISNLRSVTDNENQWNRTKAKGYYWSKEKKKWCAEIKVNYKKKHLGYFEVEKDASMAYLKAKETLHKFNNL